MAIKTTRWSPDTCDCVLEYTWDTNDSADNRTHTIATVVPCPQHTGLSNTNIFNAVNSENSRKNRFRKAVLDQFSSVLGEEVEGTDGIIHLDWKKGIDLIWRFEGTGETRVLYVSVSGYSLNVNQKNQAQAYADSTFGVGKVVVE